MPSRSLILPLLALALAACAPEESAPLGDTELVQADTKADGELRARVDGLTVWIDPVVTPVTRDGRRLWVLTGRASKNLSAVFSFVPDDPFGVARLTSARGFEVVFESNGEINSLWSGLPIFVNVTPQSGQPATAGVWLGTRFARYSGSSKIYVESAIKPVWLAGTVSYRGRAHTTSPYGALHVLDQGDDSPVIVDESARDFRLDYDFEHFLRAADPPAVKVTFQATSPTGAVVEKRAGIDVVVTQVGLTREDPYQVWETVCEADVAACLAALPAGTADAEACGSYRQVARCGYGL